MASIPPDTIRVHTAENVSVGYATAGLGSRMSAQLVDNILAVTLAVVALVGGFALAGSASTEQGAGWAVAAASAFASFVYIGYFFVCELISGGRTPGKRAMGLRVLQLDGSAPGFASIAVRNIVRIVDATGIGILVMFFQPLSRRLGDLAAGTVVVRDRPAVRLAAVTAPPLILRTPDAGPSIEGIEGLGTNEHNALRTFLMRGGLPPDLRARLAQQMAVRLCDRIQLPPGAPERAWPPELLLERMYLQLERRAR